MRLQTKVSKNHCQFVLQAQTLRSFERRIIGQRSLRICLCSLRQHSPASRCELLLKYGSCDRHEFISKPSQALVGITSQSLQLMSWCRRDGAGALYTHKPHSRPDSVSRNPTWDFSQICLWSVVETYVGLICACLPAAKAGGEHVLKKWWGKSGPSIKHLLRKAKLARSDLPKLWPTTWSSGQKLHTSATSQSATTARTSFTVSTLREDYEKEFPDLPEWEIEVDGGTRSRRLCMTTVEGKATVSRAL